MFTDIVGFTSLMGESEEKALRIRRINREIHRQRIEAHGGSWLKEMGDGTLASFSSITEAIQTTIEIRQIAKQQMGVDLKVGIHFGEVTSEDNDVFGDGVNIASRIEGLAVGGGILISESVYKDIRNKADFRTAFLGEVILKNVEGRHKIYQVLDGDLVKPTVSIKSSQRRTVLAGVAALLLALGATAYFVLWPGLFAGNNKSTSIAVLPFRNVSADISQANYGVGLATEIRSRLSQSKQFAFISSMQATMAYGVADSPAKIGDELEVNFLLSGAYQIAGDRIKIDIELVDAKSGGVVWNLSFNELFSDIFDLQSRIATRVFREFSMAEGQRDASSTQNMEAYAHYLKGLELETVKNEFERRLEAEEQLALAIQKDSSFIDAYVSLIRVKAYWIARHARLKGKEEYESVLKEVRSLKDYATAHFSDSPKYTLILGFIAYLIEKNYDAGQKYFEEVLIHDPENYEANNWIGAIYKRKLMHREAIYHLSKARKLDPSNAATWVELMIVFANMGDYASAEKAYYNGVILGAPKQSLVWIFEEQGKMAPGLEEADPFLYQLDKRLIERDFRGVIDLLDTARTVDPMTIAYWKTHAFYWLGIQDSVKHYGQVVLNQENGSNAFILAILGNKEKAIGILHEGIKTMAPSEKMFYCHFRRDEIILLSILGEYEEATQLLKELNREYPSYGRYGDLHHDPRMDKIKRESPKFVEALKALKLPQRLDLNGLITL